MQRLKFTGATSTSTIEVTSTQVICRNNIPVLHAVQLRNRKLLSRLLYVVPLSLGLAKANVVTIRLSRFLWRCVTLKVDHGKTD